MHRACCPDIGTIKGGIASCRQVSYNIIEKRTQSGSETEGVGFRTMRPKSSNNNGHVREGRGLKATLVHSQDIAVARCRAAAAHISAKIKHGTGRWGENNKQRCVYTLALAQADKLK